MDDFHEWRDDDQSSMDKLNKHLNIVLWAALGIVFFGLLFLLILIF